MRPRVLIIGLVAATGLAGMAGCSEKPQAQGQRKVGAPTHAGTGTAYQAPGWKAGDQASWNDQLRNRAQYGQNDYARTGSK